MDTNTVTKETIISTLFYKGRVSSIILPDMDIEDMLWKWGERSFMFHISFIDYILDQSEKKISNTSVVTADVYESEQMIWDSMVREKVGYLEPFTFKEFWELFISQVRDEHSNAMAEYIKSHHVYYLIDPSGNRLKASVVPKKRDGKVIFSFYSNKDENTWWCGNVNFYIKTK